MQLKLDDQMIKKLQQGDEEVFRMIDKDCRPSLSYIAAKVLDNKEWAKDVVQDTFSKFWLQRAVFNTNDQIIAFLIVTLKHGCLDELKKKERATRRERQSELLFQEEEFSKKIDQLTISVDILKVIKDIVNELPEQRKSVYEMYCDGKDVKTIAHELQLSKKTVYSHLALAVQQIQEQLKKLNFL